MKRVVVLVAVLLFGFSLSTLLKPTQITYADVPSICYGSTGASRICESEQPEQRGSFKVAKECNSARNCIELSQNYAWFVYLFNFLVETIVASAFVLLLKKPKRLILAVMLVNLISWPVLYFMTKDIGAVWLIPAEIIVWLFEASLIYLLCSKQTSLKLAFGLSALTNASTIAVGLLFLRG